MGTQCPRGDRVDSTGQRVGTDDVPTLLLLRVQLVLAGSEHESGRKNGASAMWRTRPYFSMRAIAPVPYGEL